MNVSPFDLTLSPPGSKRKIQRMFESIPYDAWWSALSERQMLFCSLVSRGWANPDIAEELGIPKSRITALQHRTYRDMVFRYVEYHLLRMFEQKTPDWTRVEGALSQVIFDCVAAMAWSAAFETVFETKSIESLKNRTTSLEKLYRVARTIYFTMEKQQ